MCWERRSWLPSGHSTNTSDVVMHNERLGMQNSMRRHSRTLSDLPFLRRRGVREYRSTGTKRAGARARRRTSTNKHRDWYKYTETHLEISSVEDPTDAHGPTSAQRGTANALERWILHPSSETLQATKDKKSLQVGVGPETVAGRAAYKCLDNSKRAYLSDLLSVRVEH